MAVWAAVYDPPPPSPGHARAHLRPPPLNVGHPHLPERTAPPMAVLAQRLHNQLPIAPPPSPHTHLPELMYSYCTSDGRPDTAPMPSIVDAPARKAQRGGGCDPCWGAGQGSGGRGGRGEEGWRRG